MPASAPHTTMDTMHTNRLDTAALDRIARKYANRPDTNEVRFALATGSSELEWSWTEEGAREPFFLASITKLFTTTILLQLRAEGRLGLDDAAAPRLTPGTLAGLHMLDGSDVSERLTIAQLMSHTTGLPDYFEGKRSDGTRLIDELAREDRGWPTGAALDMARGMRPAFAPGTPGKALYSDTNFQVLQLVIESLDGRAYAESVQARIAAPLGLDQTFIFEESSLDRFSDVAGILHGNAPFEAPRAMASFQADGGGVSTAPEALRFLRAFMQGELFPAADIDEITSTWRRVMMPLTYGTGIMRFSVPRYMTLKAVPEMIGHSGASGTLLYYVPSKDVYLVGALNQLSKRSMPYRAASEILGAL